MKKAIVLFNGPSMPVDDDFGGLPILCLNWAARRRWHAGARVDWWVSFIAQKCDKMLWEKAGRVTKVAAGYYSGVKPWFEPLGWKVDLDLDEVRGAVGRGRSMRNLDSVVDTISLAVHLGFSEIDLHGWDVQGEHQMPRWLWAQKMAALRELVDRKGLKVNRIGREPLREVMALHVKSNVPRTPNPALAITHGPTTAEEARDHQDALQAEKAAHDEWHNKTRQKVERLGVAAREVIESPWFDLHLHDVPPEALTAVQSIEGVTVEAHPSYELPDPTPTPNNLEAAAEARRICEEYQGKMPVVSPPSSTPAPDALPPRDPAVVSAIQKQQAGCRGCGDAPLAGL